VCAGDVCGVVCGVCGVWWLVVGVYAVMCCMLVCGVYRVMWDV